MANLLAKNIGFLTISQAANYVLPLVTIPYITRVVGPENYGFIEFATVAMLYFSAVVIYGFNTTATRKIAETPQNMGKVSHVFSAVMHTRVILFLLSTASFVVILFLVPQFSEQKMLMICAFPIVLGWALYPDFLFQGIQKLRVVAVANLLIKTLAAVFVFILLHKKQDFYLVLAINSGAQVLVAGGTLMYAFRSLPKLKWLALDGRAVRSYLASGWYVFLSHFFTRIHTFGTIIFLGVMLAEEDLGIFAAAMKLVIVAQSFLFLPLGGALFPYLANLAKTDFNSFLRTRRRFMFAMIGLTSVASFLVIWLAPFFVKLVFGTDYLAASPYLQLMMPILILTAISHFTMHQGLLIMRKDKIYLWIIIAAGVFSVALNILLIPVFELKGAAWAKLGVEAFMALAALFYFRKENRNMRI